MKHQNERRKKQDKTNRFSKTTDKWTQPTPLQKSATEQSETNYWGVREGRGLTLIKQAWNWACEFKWSFQRRQLSDYLNASLDG